MTVKKETALLHQPRPQTKKATTSISPEAEPVKPPVNKLRLLRLSKSIPAKEMVREVRVLYPKYDKTIQSKCERGEEYGIDLKPDAFNVLIARFAPEKVRKDRKADRHRLACRISCRLEDDDFEALQRYVEEDGFPTMQAWMAETVRRYIQRKKSQERKSE